MKSKVNYMEKQKLETFIKKYHLNGTLESVRWLSKDSKLKASAIDSDRKVLATVELNNFSGFDSSELCIKETSKLKKMLGPLSEQVNFTVNSADDGSRMISLSVSDEKTESKYVLADGDIVKAAPGIKSIPEFGVEIKLTEEFVKIFDKATSALSNANNFTLIMSSKKKKLEMVLGYSNNINSDRITMSVSTVDGKDTIKSPISFSAKILKEILDANSESKDPVLKVSEQGLALIEFTQDDFHSQYYLQKVVMED